MKLPNNSGILLMGFVVTTSVFAIISLFTGNVLIMQIFGFILILDIFIIIFISSNDDM
jgi:uncharacterized membrane protein